MSETRKRCTELLLQFLTATLLQFGGSRARRTNWTDRSARRDATVARIFASAGTLVRTRASDASGTVRLKMHAARIASAQNVGGERVRGGTLGSACAPAGALRQVMVAGESTAAGRVRDRRRRARLRTVPYPTGGRWARPRPKRSKMHVLITDARYHAAGRVFETANLQRPCRQRKTNPNTALSLSHTSLIHVSLSMRDPFHYTDDDDCVLVSLYIGPVSFSCGPDAFLSLRPYDNSNNNSNNDNNNIHYTIR